MDFKVKKFLLVIFRIVFFTFIIHLNFSVVYAFSKNTIKGSVIGVFNGSEILIKNNGVQGFSLIIKNTEKEFSVKDFVSDYYEVLDTENNNIYLKDSTKVDFKYYILNLNNNSINEIEAPHKKFETALIKKLLKGETISEIKYYEHFCDKDGTLWFRFNGTLYYNRENKNKNKNKNKNNNIRIISGIGTSDGRYLEMEGSTLSSFCKGNNDDFYAIENKELLQSNDSLKQLTNIINIDKSLSKKPFSIPYKEEYKNCNILVDKDNIIHLVSNYFVSNETIKSLHSYKLVGGNLQLMNLSDGSKNIIDATLDSEGELWLLLKGELKKIEKGTLKTYEKVDISFDKISIYDENNIILSNRSYNKDTNEIKTTYSSIIKENLWNLLQGSKEPVKSKVFIYNSKSILKDKSNVLNVNKSENKSSNTNNNESYEFRLDPTSVNGGKGEVKINLPKDTIIIPFSNLSIGSYKKDDYISIVFTASYIDKSILEKYRAINKIYEFKLCLKDKAGKVIKEVSLNGKGVEIRVNIEADQGFTENNFDENKLVAFKINKNNEFAKLNGSFDKENKKLILEMNQLGTFIIGEEDTGENLAKVILEKEITVDSKAVNNAKLSTLSLKDKLIEKLNYKNLGISVGIGTLFSMLFLTFIIRRNRNFH